jgi:hypothetical protein
VVYSALVSSFGHYVLHRALHLIYIELDVVYLSNLRIRWGPRLFTDPSPIFTPSLSSKFGPATGRVCKDDDLILIFGV